MEKSVVLITGVTSGIGKATAALLSSSGHRVYGTTRNLTRYQKTNPETPGLEILEVDITDEKSIQEAVSSILAKEDKIDVLINNAGYGTSGPAETIDINEAQDQFEVNLFSIMRMTNAVLPAMRSRQSGLIINISSIVGQMGIPFQSVYCSSKYAVEGYTESLAMEIKNLGIHTVLIEPGDIKTGFTANRKKADARGSDNIYQDAVLRSMEIVEKDEQKGSPPEKVALLIQKVMGKKSPRLRYSTGPFEQMLSLHLKRFVPQRFFEFLIMDHMKMR